MYIQKSTLIQRCKAIKSNKDSILKEKQAISRILVAEGNKLEKLLSLSNITNDDLLKANKLACTTIENLACLEMVIDLKLNLFKCEKD